MNWQNLAYALDQVAHNLGAVTVVSGPLYFLIAGESKRQRGVLWMTLTGWVVQIVSGSFLGLISLYFYGQLPDIHGVAIGALVIKIVCAITAFVFIVASLRAHDLYTGRRAAITWQVLAALAILAISAAAFLRWFS
ncbi:MAG: hypothetical protein EPN62_03220 [Candidimonas sp.]|nr:MAG: hypothetical protein EPN77_01460 [Candidimonas sp.]TAM25788.1 MAG: hypothetical protein EPN62_03220 [Candidimonas sp.]